MDLKEIKEEMLIIKQLSLDNQGILQSLGEFEKSVNKSIDILKDNEEMGIVDQKIEDLRTDINNEIQRLQVLVSNSDLDNTSVARTTAALKKRHYNKIIALLSTDKGGLSSDEIADILNIDKNIITSVITNMVNEGFFGRTSTQNNILYYSTYPNID